MLPTPTLLLLLLALFWTLNESAAHRVLPSGMSPDLFPNPDFDDNAPFCLPEKEPCGFYSFSLQGKTTPFKWIRSWCKCDAEHECVYERMDQRMRLYRQTCR